MSHHETRYDPVRPELHDRLLTIAEVADLFAVSRRTVYRLIEAGHLRPLRIGKRYRFARQDLQKDLLRQEFGR
jgi:excisionase family DNA binding protein